ncbi:ataxin-2 isoform X4 [Esox lucius]|uniref:ataxin-2 isoform X4 n=1 Tax=Esox lucius TaxID=8010 RepID=UPI001476AE7E|nr:ataxin-2 isoform X4 [Esox lucius]
MSMKQAGGNRKPGGGSSGAAAASGAGGSGGRQNLGRGRHNAKVNSSAVVYNGVYANIRMVDVLTSVVGTKCELKVKNGLVYDGVFKTYGPECDLVLDAAHRKSPESSLGPRQEDIVESIIFKPSDVVVVHFRDVDLNFARKVSTDTESFTDPGVSGRVNGEHKEKSLEPWDGGDQHRAVSDSLESLDTDVSNGWDPNDMFKYNEEQYGIKSTYDSSLATYTVALERDTSEEFLKREARAAQLAEEIEASSTFKARAALENDERSEEEKYTAVVRGEREPHPLNRENKYVPPGQRNREGMSWGAGRQNSPRLVQGVGGPPAPRPGPHDYSPSSGADQRVVNGGATSWPSPCPSPSLRPPCRYQSGPSFLPPRAVTPTRPPPRTPSRPSRPPSHPCPHGPPASVSSMPNRRMSSEGPPRMSPKTQRTPRTHRPTPGSRVPPGGDFMPHNAAGEAPVTPPTRASPSGGTWSSVVTGAHRPRSPRQNSVGGVSPSPSSLTSPQTGSASVEPVTMASASSPTAVSPSPNMPAAPLAEVKECRVQETRQNSPTANKENVKPLGSPPGVRTSKGAPSMAPDHRKQIDNLRKFSEDFRLQPSCSPDPQFEQMMTKPLRDGAEEKPKELPLDKGSEGPEGPVAPTGSSKPGSPETPSSTVCPPSEQKRGPDVTSQGVQTSASNFSGSAKPEEKEGQDPEQIRKSTLNPNAHEFKPRVFTPQPKPATTPTPPRPQAQPSPSIVVQQPQQVYSQTVCFPQMYPLTPVSPGVQSPAMYHVQVPHMTVNQSKTYRPGKVSSMPQQRADQHHLPQGGPAMMHPASAAGPPIVAQSPAYSAQYFACSPPQFAGQQMVPPMSHYQSQAQHVFAPVMQGQARMMGPPSHGQPGQLVSSTTTQYGEQTHTMYVSQGPMPPQYAHPNAALHHHHHPQPSATPTGQAQQSGQHGGSHPAPSPVQQHHMGGQQQMYQALAPTPPSMTSGPNPQSPQGSFPSAQQTLYIHPQQVQHGYNPAHMAHMQQVSSTFRSPPLHSEYMLFMQAHMQSGMVASHHGTPGHPQMMLMTTQQPGGPQPQLPQNALNPIPVSSTTHFSYLTHPQVQQHHQL